MFHLMEDRVEGERRLCLVLTMFSDLFVKLYLSGLFSFLFLRQSYCFLYTPYEKVQ